MLRHLNHHQTGVRPILPLIPPSVFRRRTSVGGYMIDSQPLAHIACLGGRISGPDAMVAPTVVVACPGVGRRRGEKRVCAGFRAQTRSGLGRTRPAGTPTP